MTNRAECDAGLRARGNLAVWFTPEAVAAWKAEPRTSQGGQLSYSTVAIAGALTLRAVFRLALRQTEGLIGSILQLLGLDLALPDHSTLSRRAKTLEVARPKAGCARAPAGGQQRSPPLRARRVAGGEARHEAAPSLESAAPRHGRRHRPDRRLGADRQGSRRRLAGRSPARPDRRAVASFTGGGAYDLDDVYAEVAARHPEAAVVVPPRANAVPSEAGSPRRRGAMCICDASRSAAAWAGRGPRGMAGAPSWSPASRDGSVSSVMGCAHKSTRDRRPRWPSRPTC